MTTVTTPVKKYSFWIFIIILVISGIFIEMYITQFYDIGTSRTAPDNSFKISSDNSNDHNKTRCMKILHYKDYKRALPIGAGIDHNTVLFEMQLMHAMYDEFTHIIIEPFELSKAHNFNNKANGDISLYFNLNQLSKDINISILEPNVNIITNQTIYIPFKDICNTVFPTKCNITVIITNFPSWWTTDNLKCLNETNYFGKSFALNFDKLPLSPTLNNCLNEFKTNILSKISNNTNNNMCIIYGLIRKGDRENPKVLYHYNQNWIHVINDINMGTFILYINHKYCHDDNVVIYLASNGKNNYLKNFENYINNITTNYNKSFVYLYKNKIFSKIRGNLFKENNYLFYLFEKNLHLIFDNNHYSKVLSFNINPKYHTKILEKSVIIKTKINGKINDSLITFNEITNWAKLNKLKWPFQHEIRL